MQSESGQRSYIRTLAIVYVFYATLLLGAGLVEMLQEASDIGSEKLWKHASPVISVTAVAMMLPVAALFYGNRKSHNFFIELLYTPRGDGNNEKSRS